MQKPNVDTPRRLHAGGFRRIYLDLDGVVADFYGFAREVIGSDYHTVPPAVAWGCLERVPHLYRQLKPLNGARELFDSLSRLGPVTILSAIPLPTGCLVTAAADKRAWVRQELSPGVQVITVCGGDRKALFAAPDCLLVDDSQRNIEAWTAVGGVSIKHVSIETTFGELAAL